MRWIRPLTDITLADIEQVGGKAAHLGALLRAGFPVPPGFVITVDAFVDHFGLTTDPLVRPPIPRLQAELMAEVVQATLDNLGSEAELAVRSSSSEEDDAHASFAGLHSTYYFVTPHRLDQAILDCWMSLWSRPAIAYRRQGWTEISSGEPVRMAVIVQQMLKATRSGVVFSKDPVTPASTECVIEATWGLGAALVDGRVSPDHIRLNDNAELLKYTIADKRVQVTANPSNPDASRLQEVPEELRNTPVLTEPEAEHLANLSLQLETLFDHPQDVEWAFVDEELYLLQSRPITTSTSTHHISERLVLFKPLAENFTEPLTPMTADLVAQVMPKIGAFFEGRFYLDLDKVAKVVPFKVSNDQLVDLALLRTKPQRYEWSLGGMLRLAALISGGFLADGANWIRTSRISQASLAGYAQLAERVAHNPRMEPRQALLKLFWGQIPFEPIYRQVFFANVSAGRYFLLIGMLQRLVEKYAPDYPLAELSKTYHGSEELTSLSLIDRFDELGAVLRDTLAADPEFLERLDDQRALPSDHAFTREFERFIHDYGHRGPREMEFAAPRWRETPGLLLNMLQTQVQSQTSPEPPRRQVHGSHLAARDQLHQHLNVWQRWLADRLIGRIAYYIALRENTRHYHIGAFDVVRKKLLALEQELLHNGCLRTPGDIFFLTLEEAQQLQATVLNAATAHEQIRRRRREWQRQARQRPLETVNIKLAPQAHPTGDLTGHCASPGYCEGIARVITSLHEAQSLAPGEILVAPYTDPAWTPLFSRAAAVVVGTGSFLSHAGTVARELHIPCIVDVTDCVRQISSGTRIRVDATNGYVEIIT